MSSISSSKQHAWVGDSVIGHSIDPFSRRVDLTEGFGAFDSVFKITQALTGRAIDMGGGSSDANSAYIAQRYLVDSVVYDPYMRSKEHNEGILKTAKERPFATVLSLSVLNVISCSEARKDYLKLCLKMLKLGGKAIFKVWPGDKSGQGITTSSGYQSNRDILSYFTDIFSVFGKEMVRYDSSQEAVLCFSKVDIYPSGSACIG